MKNAKYNKVWGTQNTIFAQTMCFPKLLDKSLAYLNMVCIVSLKKTVETQ